MNVSQELDQQTILIVDDSPSAVKVFEIILRQECQVAIATSGKEALQMVKQLQPDLILLDVMMPEMDGYELCRRLKSDAETLHIPVVFLTAQETEDDAAHGLEVGAIDYIIKSYDPTLAKARIRNYLKRDLVEKNNRQLSQQNQMILAAAGEGIFGIDINGMITFVNPASCQMLGWQAGELIGKQAHSTIHHSRSSGQPYPTEQCPMHRAICDGTVHRDNKEVFWRKDGSSFPAEYVATPIQSGQNGQNGQANKNGQADKRGITTTQGAVVVFRDISQQKQTEIREIHSQISRIAISALLETSLEPLSLAQQLHVALQIILSVSWLSIEYKGSIFLVDESSQTLSMAAQLGLPDVLLKKCANIPFGRCLCGRAAQEKKICFSNALDHRHDVTFPGISEHGHYCAPITSHQRLLGVLNLYLPHNHHHDPEEDAFIVTIANTLAGIIERRKLENQLEHTRKELDHLARHDTLTGLPNRMLFHERLQQSLVRSRRERSMMALLFVDLDRFKCVNDLFGHETGDMLLTQVAHDIQALLREADTVARMGGDEFTIILSNITHIEDATLVAEKIITRLCRPFRIQSNTCRIGASIGVSIYPMHGENADALLKTADAAMYHVKEKGRNHFLLYQKGMEKI